MVEGWRWNTGCGCCDKVLTLSGILNWVPGGLSISSTRPCVIKFNSAGVVQWQSDPGFEPREIAVDDVDRVYVRLLSGPTAGSAALDQTTGVKQASFFSAKGRLLNHPADIAGTFKLSNVGPGSDTLISSSGNLLVGDSNDYISHLGHWASNDNYEYIYIVGAASGRYNTNGTRKFGFSFIPTKLISPIADVWINSNGDAFVCGQKSGDSSQGYVYKYNAADGSRAWIADVVGCYVSVTGDNNGNIICGGGDYSDGSNILQLDETTGAVNWGVDTGAGSNVYDIACDSSGNVAVVGRSSGSNKNVWYVTSGGSLSWSANHHPHNPFGGGTNCFAVCFDSSGNVYATGERI